MKVLVWGMGAILTASIATFVGLAAAFSVHEMPGPQTIAASMGAVVVGVFTWVVTAGIVGMFVGLIWK